MMARLLLSLLAMLLLTGAREPTLVPEISQHEIQVRQGFTGAELLLFGAIVDPSGVTDKSKVDVVVVLRGPTESIVLREKQRVAGIWVNAESAELRSAPHFFAVASTRPISEIVDNKTAAIFELGLPWLQLSPIGAIDPAKQKRFAAGLVELMARHGLYSEDAAGVGFKENVLYQARIKLPSQVQTGSYTAETFAIVRGRVIASGISRVEVRKLGFEGAVASFADRFGFAYGLSVIALSLGMGWLAGRIFAMI